MRTDYPGKPLLESEAGDDPIALFERWFALAAEHDPDMANATTLATVAADGRPTARLVLLKGVADGGFVFYTNYRSAKAEDLAHEPRAALCFWWPTLLRQVRIEGTCAKLDRAVSEAYFADRPRGSQIGALASDQSQVIPDRGTLERRAAELEKRYENQPVPMPPQWGGYRLTPAMIEFWQGRLSRLHDRLRFGRQGDTWRRERLSP